LFTDLHILYLHGFLSGPQSSKAQQTVAYCNSRGLSGRIHVPFLKFGPIATMVELRALIDTLPIDRLGLIGSSLGGFYATCLAEQFNLPAVLINPAVGPFDTWSSYLGDHRNYYIDYVHKVTQDYIGELHELDCKALKYPHNFRVMLQTDDETLDYRLAAEKFSEAELVIRQGGNHSYEGYAEELPAIESFFLSRIAESVR
tara:strand:- start:10751 stop:11353 length:603 start_codon:yes stop_codon:yes gene_type:complete